MQLRDLADRGIKPIFNLNKKTNDVFANSTNTLIQEKFEIAKE